MTELKEGETFERNIFCKIIDLKIVDSIDYEEEKTCTRKTND